MMVKVYFESKYHSELAAEFASEELYMAALPALEAEAKKHRMTVQEVMSEED